MKLNYTQRLIVSVSLYTSILFCVSLGAAWFTFESTEQNEYEKTVLQVNTLIKSLMNEETSLISSHPANGIGLYLTNDQLPEEYKQIESTGLHSLSNGDTVIMDYHPVTHNPYYLLLASPHPGGENIDNEFSDLMILLLGLMMATFISGGMAWFLARRLAEPVIQLRQQINQINAKDLSLTVIDRDDEVGELSRSISSLVTRVNQFTRREQDFTRFASHELRTPITIIKGNIELLSSTLPADARIDRALKRMNKATDRMSVLVRTFLWLSREGTDNEQEDCLIGLTQFNTMIEECIQHLNKEDADRIKLQGEDINWLSNRFLISIILENLVNNAIKYSSGIITITAESESFSVENIKENPSIPSSTGLGLLIVQRICEAKGWQFNLVSDDHRFSVTIGGITTG